MLLLILLVSIIEEIRIEGIEKLLLRSFIESLKILMEEGLKAKLGLIFLIPVVGIPPKFSCHIRMGTKVPLTSHPSLKEDKSPFLYYR